MLLCDPLGRSTDDIRQVLGRTATETEAQLRVREFSAIDEPLLNDVSGYIQTEIEGECGFTRSGNSGLAIDMVSTVNSYYVIPAAVGEGIPLTGVLADSNQKDELFTEINRRNKVIHEFRNHLLVNTLDQTIDWKS